MNQSDLQNIYKAIVLGINSDELLIWAKEAVSEKASEVKTATQLKK